MYTFCTLLVTDLCGKLYIEFNKLQLPWVITFENDSFYMCFNLFVVLQLLIFHSEGTSGLKLVFFAAIAA
jgi:hypothetical protein